MEANNIKKIIKHGFLIIALFFCILMLGSYGLKLVTLDYLINQDERVVEAKITKMLTNITWYAWVGRIVTAIGAIVLLIVIPIRIILPAWTRHKQSKIHQWKIGNSSGVVEEKHLHDFNIISNGLTVAEQLEKIHGGEARAFGIYTKMADVQTKQIGALLGRSGIHGNLTRVQASESQHALPEHMQTTPTFAQLLESGELAYGKPMILGYENGIPRRGSFLDIYSSAIAGESGSGKTSTMLFLIGSGLLCEHVRYIAIDPHYPHPQSLGKKTQSLWEAGFMRIATLKDDILEVLAEVEQTIDDRLHQIDINTTPIVLVIDELAFLTKTCTASSVTHTMERISTEGRKVSVYMLASSQTWLASRTGKDSVVRDTLTSAYVHRIKPKQANLLLQDKDDVNKVKKYVKQAGDVLFCPVGGESVISKIPFTTEYDMKMLATTLQPRTPHVVSPASSADVTSCDSVQNIQSESSNECTDENVKQLPESQALEIPTEWDRKMYQQCMVKYQISQSQIDKAGIGVPKSTLSNYLRNPEKDLTREQHEHLQNYLIFTMTSKA